MSSADSTSLPEILVVDDDPISRDLLVMMLKSAKINVIAANDGQHATEIIAAQTNGVFEAVFTDVQMPRMNGLELLEWLNIHAPTTATVMITGTQERKVVSDSLRGGAVEFLDKPFDLKSILNAVRQARETHRRRTQQLAAAARLRDISEINQRLTRTALGSKINTSATVNLVTRFYAINEASGDLVKATALDTDRLLLVLGDVSGHGLKEGFLSAYFQGIIEGMANQAATPRSIAESFNRFLNEQWNDDSHSLAIATSLSACFLEVDLGMRRVSVLNCGSPGVILTDRLGEVQILAPGGSPLGWFPEIEPARVSVQLDTAGQIILWSDGLEDHAKKLEVSALALAYRILNSPPNSLSQTILKDAADDVLACRLEWGPPRTSELSGDIWIPFHNERFHGNSADRIDDIQASLEKVITFTFPHLNEDILHDIKLCIREALLNALIHGCKSAPDKFARIELLVDSAAAFLHTRITDEGEGFDFNNPNDRNDPEHISLGMQVIRSLTHATRHSNQGRTIEMTFCLPTTPRP